MNMMDDVRLELGPAYNKIYAGWLYKGDSLVAKLPLHAEFTRDRAKMLVAHFMATGETLTFACSASFDAFLAGCSSHGISDLEALHA